MSGAETWSGTGPGSIFGPCEWSQVGPGTIFRLCTQLFLKWFQTIFDFFPMCLDCSENMVPVWVLASPLLLGTSRGDRSHPHPHSPHPHSTLQGQRVSSARSRGCMRGGLLVPQIPGQSPRVQSVESRSACANHCAKVESSNTPPPHGCATHSCQVHDRSCDAIKMSHRFAALRQDDGPMLGFTRQDVF